MVNETDKQVIVRPYFWQITLLYEYQLKRSYISYISFAILESHWSKKASTADIMSSYELFSPLSYVIKYSNLSYQMQIMNSFIFTRDKVLIFICYMHCIMLCVCMCVCLHKYMYVVNVCAHAYMCVEYV